MTNWEKLPDCLKMCIFEFSDEFKTFFSKEVVPDIYLGILYRNVRLTAQVLQEVFSSFNEEEVENFKFRQSKRKKQYIQVLLPNCNGNGFNVIGEVGVMFNTNDIKTLIISTELIWIEEGIYHFGSVELFLLHLIHMGSESFYLENFTNSE
jgi:hypothetical protein